MRRWWILALVVVGALGAGAFALADSAHEPVDYRSGSGAVYTGLRPTAVGLPQIGESGTVGANELPSALRAYHDSGAYAADLAAVGAAAKAYLDQRLGATGGTAKVCRTVYRRARGHRRPRLYKRVRSCRHVARPAAPVKPAIVLDIDETALSNYSGLASSNFSEAGLVAPAALGTGTAIGPTLDLYRDARVHGAAVFFVTGRPSAISSITATNLENVGYDQGWNAIDCKPSNLGTLAFKSSTRAQIEQQGYDVVLNMGDQESDLDGGHADRDFKLPNPFYFIGD